MASQSPVLTLVLVVVWWEKMHCSTLSADPPEDIQILDPGHLGYLEITWRPPASLVNMSECVLMYHLEYFNTYKNRWNVINTVNQKYAAQFDLTKDVRIKVRTLLSGPCTNGTQVRGSDFAELVQKPPSRGLAGTAVENFAFVFHNMEQMVCVWRAGPNTTANAQQSLYYWHKDLEQTEECPQYLISNGVRSGCNLTAQPLPVFTNVNFCVNGSSPQGPLKPTYVTLQVQNYVKPDTAEKLHLQAGSDAPLELYWKNPVGKVPGRCLEWEVEHKHVGPRGKNASIISTKLTALTLRSVHKKERNCFRVRSRMHKYCAESGFWSNWSHQICHPGEPAPAVPALEAAPVLVYLAMAVIATLMLSLCAWATLRAKGGWEVEKLAHLRSLLGRNAAFSVEEA